MSEDQSTWTLDDSARAGNPGNVRVNRFRWFRNYPKWPLIWFSAWCSALPWHTSDPLGLLDCCRVASRYKRFLPAARP